MCRIFCKVASLRIAATIDTAIRGSVLFQPNITIPPMVAGIKEMLTIFIR
jgi:hypothetical protein